MKFTRNQPPKRYQEYHRYRQYTRSDFQRVCAHCFRHEDEAGGEAHFVQDHFEPKHRPNVDPADYFNLYWSCVECNSPQNKGATWPTDAEIESGEKFCDPCEHDPVGSDYKETHDGTLDALTSAGRYTIRHIRLSERPALVNLRVTRRRVKGQYTALLARLRSSLRLWRSRLQQRHSKEALEKCEKLESLVDAYESFVTREPFMCCFPFPREIPDELITGI